MKGTLPGEGGGFDFGSNLYYMSLHTLDSKSGVSYAKTRVMRELLDQWLAKRLAFNGIKFNDSAVALTDQDFDLSCLNAIPMICNIFWIRTIVTKYLQCILHHIPLPFYTSQLIFSYIRRI